MKEAIVIYSERVMQVVVGFLVTYLVINHFNADDYGMYKYIISLSSAFMLLVLFGYNAANVRYIPEYLLHREHSKLNYQIFVFSIIQLLFIVFFLYLLYCLLDNDAIVLDENITISYMFSIFVFNYLKTYFGESLLVAFSRRILLTYIRFFLYFVQILIIYYAIKSEVDIKNFLYYIAFYAGVESLILLVGAIAVYKKIIPRVKFKKFDLSKQYKYSFNNYGFSLVNFLRDNASTIIVVTYLYSYTAVAYYSVALIIPNIVRSFSPSKIFSGLIMPELVKKYSLTKDKDVVLEGLDFLSKMNLIFLIPSVVYSVFLYYFVIETFFSFEYANNSFNLSLFLFVNVLFLSYLDLNYLAINIFEKSRFLFKINLISISNIFFLFVLNEFGEISIGVSNLLSTLATVIVFGIITEKTYSKKIKLNFLEKNIVIFTIFLVVVSLILFNINKYMYIFMFPFFSLVCAFKMTKTTLFYEFEREFIRKNFSLYSKF